MNAKTGLRRLTLGAALVLTLVLGLVGVAWAAPPWSDVDAPLLAGYGLTEPDLAAISSGYPDGSWKPLVDMPRRHFVKMAVEAYGIPTATPATPTFADVDAHNEFYGYIEGAVAAGLIQGVGDGRFAPDATITRQQGAAIIARYVAAERGVNLQTEYSESEALAALAGYSDAAHVTHQLLPEIAFAVEEGILKGSAGKLNPAADLLRIQGAALIVRSLASLLPDIVDTAVADGRFTTLVGALQATGLDEALKGTGPFTVFAPTDAAFAALPAGLLESLTTEQLTNILLYHVVSGKVLAADVVGLDGEFVNTLLAGQQVLVSVDGGVKINDANVVITDILCSNGVIHVIDAVLVPGF